MAPSHSRQLLAWTFPTIAILLSYLWFKRKRIGVRSDPGGTKQQSSVETSDQHSPEPEPIEKPSPTVERTFSRSLSGVDTAPIDIVFPRELRLAKSNPVVISDEDLDFEIEKIKSMKNRSEPVVKSKPTTAATEESKPKSPVEAAIKTPSPKKENAPIKSAEVLPNNTEIVVKKKTPKMAQKDVVSVDEKFSALKLGNKETPKKKNKNKQAKVAVAVAVTNMNNSDHQDELHRQSSERDSANHSPADVMLASPSLSSISDNHSEGSSDSGKGGSEVATPPSRTPAGDGSVADDIALPSVYEFVIPQTLVGRLIGRHGNFVAEIKEKTHAHILIKKHPGSNKLKVCAVEGAQLEIENALHMIREKFPVKHYPEVTLEQVSFLPAISTIPLMPDQVYLKLIEGINNDTIVSCMVTPGHLFLQQPTHPSFPSLNVLSGYINMCYSETDSPLLPNPIPENTVCVAESVGAWYRAMVLSTDMESDTSYVKFLDYGGFAYVESSKLRQIRGDFLLLPFQAAECLLANVRPCGGSEESVWPEEAYNYVAELTKGAIVYTQISDYTEDGIPLVYCYVVVGPQQYVFLNEELVNRGYAEWVTYQQQEEVEGAVGGVV